MYALNMCEADMVSGGSIWADIGGGLEIVAGGALVVVGVASALATDGLDAPAAAAAVRTGVGMAAGEVATIGGGVATIGG